MPQSIYATAFPTLPVRAHFNRLLRRHRDGVVAFYIHLVDLMGARNCPYEALDGYPLETSSAVEGDGLQARPT